MFHNVTVSHLCFVVVVVLCCVAFERERFIHIFLFCLFFTITFVFVCACACATMNKQIADALEWVVVLWGMGGWMVGVGDCLSMMENIMYNIVYIGMDIFDRYFEYILSV